MRPIPVQGVFQPQVLPQLGGPVADVYAMRDLLVNFYDFKKPSVSLSERENDDIQILINENATADRILTLLKTHLIDKARPGDISVFYFAGHGSRIRQRPLGKARPPGRTMVPADYALGVPAIRDKELARIYRQVPDGVSLTVIQDNCYSGGGARGAAPSLHSRDLPDDPRVVSDPPDEQNGKRLPYPDQQKNPVLVLAASQADQVALEAHMGDDVGYRGVFTYALVKTLQNSVTHERVDEIFRKLRANMGMDRQEPVVSGKGRLRSGFIRPESHTGEQRLRNRAIAGRSTGAIGRRHRERHARGLHFEKGLGGPRARSDPHPGEGDDGVGHVDRRSDRRCGPGRDSQRRQISGGGVRGQPRSAIHGICACEIVRGERASANGFGGADKLASAGVTWVDNPAQEPAPTHTLVWNGTSWQLYSSDSPAPADLGAALAGRSVLAKIADPGQARLFLETPPPNELLARLAIGKGETAAIRVTDGDPAGATYALAGALRGKDLVYFWLRSARTGEQFPPLSTPIAAADPGAVDNFPDDIRTLDRVAGWLTLSAAGEIDPPFPYHLALKRVGGNTEVAEKEVVEGEKYKLYLEGDRGQLDALLKLNESPVKRYVYVGITDSAGHGQLLFPEPGAGNQGNRFPVVEKTKATARCRRRSR